MLICLLRQLKACPTLFNANNLAIYFFCRKLCIEALVEEGDQDQDWRLSASEFFRLMDENYEPSNKCKELYLQPSLLYLQDVNRLYPYYVGTTLGMSLLPLR